MGRLAFQLQAKATGSAARAGIFKTLHSTEIRTPLFMPVGTNASVKGLRVEDLAITGSQILLANTYHLLLRPGPDVFKATGGIHNFTNWKGSFLTDSGGFQIFSLPHARNMTEEGALFRSYVDGQNILLTPELSIETQKAIGSDIMMVLDQCIPSTSDYATSQHAMELTHRWAERSLKARRDSNQAIFGIVQGALHKGLREQSAKALIQMDFDGYAIGGLAVGETKSERDSFTQFTAALLPSDKPRYSMGIGTPIDLLEAVHAGVDMFDCIIPTALAQQGVAYTSTGKMRLTRSVYKFADEPIDISCKCYTCQSYTKAYVHHLHKAAEPLAWQLTSIHNLTFYHSLMSTMRLHILNDTFLSFYETQRDILVRQDIDRPPGERPKKRIAKNYEEKGVFTIHQSKDGFFTVKDKTSGEVMHPGGDPNLEAEELYVGQSQLAERLVESSRELIVWDVGLGAAYNAMAVIRCAESKTRSKTPSNQRSHSTLEKGNPNAFPKLRIISFENNLDAISLALINVGRQPHLQHPAPRLLLEEGSWCSKDLSVSWSLEKGDFAEKFKGSPKPDIIFYDPFSAKTNETLWTLQLFEEIFDKIKDHDSELFSYTASTRIRATLLGAGFIVAKGDATRMKGETTFAMTDKALRRRDSKNRRPSLLNSDWIGRWTRSDSRFPLDLSIDDQADFERKILQHSQFQELVKP